MIDIVVCVKQVPDTNEIRIDPKTNNLVREGVSGIINPFDACALEIATRLRETCGGSVTAVTMGPPQAEAVLQYALDMGADYTAPIPRDTKEKKISYNGA